MFQAAERFLCCERSAWTTTAIPVGIWVRRTADSVLLTCWPPAPPERMVSVRTSDSLMSMTMRSSITGKMPTLANEVWRRALESNGEMRTRRCRSEERRVGEGVRGGGAPEPWAVDDSDGLD